MSKPTRELATLLSVLLLAACNTSINEDVRVTAASGAEGAMTINGNVSVEKGTVVDNGDFSTVNGNIEVAERAEVQSLRAVNGSITLGEEARARDVQSVNGRLELGRNAQISGGVKLVNGEVSLAPGSQVGGNIKTVNGEIAARGATINGDVSNYRGGMLITEESVVRGNLTVLKPEEPENAEPPRIVIGPGSKVLGSLKFERPVLLYVHESAEIGPVDGAEAIRFSGAMPEAG